jgi:hypothetical protein
MGTDPRITRLGTMTHAMVEVQVEGHGIARVDATASTGVRRRKTLIVILADKPIAHLDPVTVYTCRGWRIRESSNPDDHWLPCPMAGLIRACRRYIDHQLEDNTT